MTSGCTAHRTSGILAPIGALFADERKKPYTHRRHIWFVMGRVRAIYAPCAIYGSCRISDGALCRPARDEELRRAFAPATPPREDSVSMLIIIFRSPFVKQIRQKSRILPLFPERNFIPIAPLFFCPAPLASICHFPLFICNPLLSLHLHASILSAQMIFLRLVTFTAFSCRQHIPPEDSSRKQKKARRILRAFPFFAPIPIKNGYLPSFPAPLSVVYGACASL